MRSTEVQIWPAFANAPSAACSGGPDRVDVGVDDERVVAAVLAGSRARRCGRRPAASARPVAVEPTCAMTATPACAREGGARRAVAGRRARARPRAGAAARISSSSAPVCGLRSLGLCTTVSPETIAAPSRPAATATGSFHGVSASDDAARAAAWRRRRRRHAPRRRLPRCSGPELRVLQQRVDGRPRRRPRASPADLPVSRVFSAATSSARAASASARPQERARARRAPWRPRPRRH